ncbi:phospholipid-binding protein MlaC [Pseudooceanicola sp. LIPI14-2-Ac024]|uniref:MlaC/ttg2D family ABC transporter substrate-binding protein n=1 Tax=Pseudooceanicola sp. LIPI14-2-Ac024 TaxID=3344875 RepID=UPI0035CF08CB
MRNRPTRRAIVLGLAGIGFAAGFARPLFALSDQSARATVEKLVGDINAVIASGKSEAAMIKDFENIFARYADVNIIARSVLGPDARRFSEAELNAYTQAFRGYIGRKYGKRFREFIGGKIELTGVQPVKTWHEVSGMAILKNEAPFEVRFFVSDRSGKPLFFDMFIEGVSMRLSERTEIGAMLDQNGGDIRRLTAALQRAG